jgi:hypothetical protein
MFFDNLLATTTKTISNPDTLIDFMSQSFDVKNMYTELPHASIVTAIEWLLHESQLTRFGRHKRVHLALSGRRNVAFQRSGGFVHITYTQLITFVLFDLANVYFTLGTTILRQHNGIPMGSPISPALAIIVCAHAEHLFKQTISDFPNFFAARYMDDLHATCTFAVTDITGRRRAEEIFDNLRNIYPAALTLELTATGSTDFLETSISYPSLPCSLSSLTNPSSDSFPTRQLNKNKNCLSKTHLNFTRLQHSLSYRRPSQTAGALMGSFLRLPRHSSSTNTAFLSAIELLLELHHLKYSPHTLQKTIKKLSYNHPNPLWPHLLTLVTTPSYPIFISKLKSLL